MNVKAGSIVLALVISAVCSLSFNQAVSGKPIAKPMKLEGSSYLAARRTILALGWRPLDGACSGGGISDFTCRAFPEVGNCSGSGSGYCDMTFVRKDRCLVVVTVGGVPSVSNNREPVVRDIVFSQGPCSKN
jgi:hypothetical protein